MRYLCIVSPLLSADGDQRCHFKEKSGEIAAPDVSIVWLGQMGSAEKWFSATYIKGYLKKQNQFNCTLNLGFFTA